MQQPGFHISGCQSWINGGSVARIMQVKSLGIVLLALSLLWQHNQEARECLDQGGAHQAAMLNWSCANDGAFQLLAQQVAQKALPPVEIGR